MCRHPQLRFRKSQAPSAATATEFTKENIAKFVVVLKANAAAH
jgi:hypothetical protein